MACSRPVKSAVQRQACIIARDLTVNQHHMNKILAKKIFSEEQVKEIKEQTGDENKAYKLLDLLKTSGERELHDYIEILREDHNWLADELEDMFRQKLEEYSREDCKNKEHSFHRSLNSEPDLPMLEQIQGYRTGRRRSLSSEGGVRLRSEAATRDACLSPLKVIESPRKTCDCTANTARIGFGPTNPAETDKKHNRQILRVSDDITAMSINISTTYHPDKAGRGQENKGDLENGKDTYDGGHLLSFNKSERLSKNYSTERAEVYKRLTILNGNPKQMDSNREIDQTMLDEELDKLEKKMAKQTETIRNCAKLFPSLSQEQHLATCIKRVMENKDKENNKLLDEMACLAEKYETQLRNQHKVNENLRKEKHELSAENESLDKALQDKTMENDQLEEALDKKDECLRKLEKENDELQEKLANLKAAKKTSNKQLPRKSMPRDRLPSIAKMFSKRQQIRK